MDNTSKNNRTGSFDIKVLKKTVWIYISSLFDYVLLFLVTMFVPMSCRPAYCNLLIDMGGLTCSVNTADKVVMDCCNSVAAVKNTTTAATLMTGKEILILLFLLRK